MALRPLRVSTPASRSALFLLAACAKPAWAEKRRPEALSPDRRGGRGRCQARHTLTVRHDAVPGLMGAMTMEFAVSAGDAASVHPGERIRAELVADLQAPRLRKVDLAGRQGRRGHPAGGGGAPFAARTPTIAATAPSAISVRDDAGLRRLTTRRARSSKARASAAGRSCSISSILAARLRTCSPLSTAKMMTTQRLAREAKVPGHIEFISIT